jgi:hypothetical protein
VENKYIILDSSFTASSYYDWRYVSSNGRLNSVHGWGPRTNAENEYLQIDLGYPYVICSIATQGMSTAYEWVTQYKINTSLDNSRYTTYRENGKIKASLTGTSRKI